MAIINLPYGEEEKASGNYLINTDKIWYILYHSINKGVIAQGGSSEPYAEVFFSSGRASIILNKVQYDIIERLWA